MCRASRGSFVSLVLSTTRRQIGRQGNNITLSSSYFRHLEDAVHGARLAVRLRMWDSIDMGRGRGTPRGRRPRNRRTVCQEYLVPASPRPVRARCGWDKLRRRTARSSLLQKLIRLCVLLRSLRRRSRRVARLAGRRPAIGVEPRIKGHYEVATVEGEASEAVVKEQPP